MGSQIQTRFEGGHWYGLGGGDALVTLTEADSGTRNLTTDPYQKVVVGGTPVLAVPVLPCGARIVVQVVQDATGSRIPTWTGVSWAAGSAPTLSTAPAAVDFIVLESDGVTVWGFLLGNWVWSGVGSLVTLTPATSGTRNVTTSAYQKVVVGGTPVLAVPALLCGQRVLLQVVQDATGTRIPTWTGVKWAAGTAPVLSTGANAVDRVLLEGDGVDVWGSLIGKAFA